MNFTDEQMQVINDYCANSSAKLKKICMPIIFQKGVPQSEYDDLISDALKVLMESVLSYNKEKGSFQTYLVGNIKRSFYDWTRDKTRAKRCNLVRDENGKPIKDENGKTIKLSDISFDLEDEEGVNIAEKIPSKFDVEQECNISFDEEDKVGEFLKTLSNMEKNILVLKMQGNSVGQIINKLQITNREYSSVMRSLKMNEYLSIFIKNNRVYTDIGEENIMERIIEINEANNYRMDKQTMFSLLQDKKNGDINCHYILQRQPFQWTDEERNRYICRILSNLPIPEIILCEQNKKGITIAHLIDGLQRLSYAEAYRENRFKISSKGAERHLIQYQDYQMDENGNRILDEEGLPIVDIKVCDVIGKDYDELPDVLKKRFNNFNINVTRFFDCTDQQIADHIRDYNNHTSMNKEQSSMTKIGTKTATKIKNISSKNVFFKNCGAFSNKIKIKGKIDRVVAEALMLIFHKEDWRTDISSLYKYIDENTTDGEFTILDNELNRLAVAIGENNKVVNKLFTPTKTPLLLAIFHEFIKYDIYDSKFVDFLNAYATQEMEKIEINGVSIESFGTSNTKTKYALLEKYNILVTLMKQYLHIEEISETNNLENNNVYNNTGNNENNVVEDNTTDEMKENINIENKILHKEEISSEVETPEETELDFIKRNVDENTTEDDLSFYKAILDDLTVEVDNNSKLLEKKNNKSLLSLVAYSVCNDIDLDNWIVDYFNKHSDYIENQKENYINMKNNLDTYRMEKGA